MTTGYRQLVQHATTERESARLAALAQALDPLSQRRLTTVLDHRYGMRMLEVGPGVGTIAQWLGQQYGPQELVLLDQDRDVLSRFSRPGIRTVTADITDPSTAQPGTFGLIHARCVLMHLPSLSEVVNRLASWLAPGGSLVISDLVGSTDFCQHPDIARASIALQVAVCTAAGTDQTWGACAPLRHAGLAEIGVAFDTPTLNGGDSFCTWLSMTLTLLRAQVLDTGLLTAAQLDTAIRDLHQPDLATGSPLTLVTTWGQRVEKR